MFGTVVDMTRIAIIGGGNIGEALAAGLVAAGEKPRSITVTNRRPERGEELAERYGVQVSCDNRQAVKNTEVVFLCVKPYAIIPCLTEISTAVDDETDGAVVVSMAAGVPLAELEEVVSAGTAVVRVMPNTPMALGKGVCAVVPGRFAGEDEVDIVERLLSTVGTTVSVSEQDIDAVTALSGSSPAYVFLLVEAMIDAGVQLGIARAQAETLAVGAIAGAAAMLEGSGKTPVDLRASVCSPAGTTVAAVRSLEESGLRAAMYRAMEACALRSKELSQKR